MANEFVVRNGLLALDNSVISGSLTVTGGITGSFSGTGSYAAFALSSSNSLTSSFAFQAANASNAVSASFATVAANASSASYALSSSFAFQAANAASASSATNAVTASHAVNAVTASRALNANTASYVQNAASASYALSSSYALNASTATSASFTSNASTAASASFATNASTAASASYATNAGTAGSASFATTSSFVNTLNQSVLITGSLTVGSTTPGVDENTLTLGPKGTNEGGQLLLQAGTSYTSASMLDVYNDGANPYFRILRGSNAGSDAIIAQFNIHTKQFFLPTYNSPSSFPGTAAANLAVNSNGDVITVAPGTTTSASYAVSSSYAMSASFASRAANASSASYAATASYAYFGISSSFASNAANASSASAATFASTASLAQSLTPGTIVSASNVFVSNNLVVNGTASFSFLQTVSGSAVVIGEEYIVLNTQSPVNRFAGLIINDSGSNSTASIVWDSERNHFVYTNASGSTYNGGGFMSGPRNTGSLGSEPYPTLNRVLRGQGGDHLYDSNITDNDTNIILGINTQITGTLGVTGTITGNLTGTSSFATTASFAFNAANASSASFATSAANATTASHALVAVTASRALNANTASFATLAANASSASYSTNAGFAGSASFATSAANATTASHALQAVTASFALNSQNAFVQGGNSFGAQALLGTNDTQNLAFETNGTVRMVISGSGGQVGIGTTTLASQITASVLNLKANIADGNQLYIIQENDDRGWKFKAKNSGHLFIQSSYVGVNTDLFTILYDTGNVGINSTSPAYKLDVNGGAADTTIAAQTTGQNPVRLRLKNEERDFILTNNPVDDLLSFNYDGVNRLQFNLTNQWFTSGNVGIGTTLPVTKLHIDSALGVDVISISDAAGAVRLALGQESSYQGNYIDSKNIDFKIKTYLSGGSGGNIIFQTGTGSVSEKVRINGTGNVGIGTSLPSQRLSVSGSIESLTDGLGEGGQFIVRGPVYRFNIDNYFGNVLRIFREDDSTQANGTVLLTISGSSGSVGIGSTNPAYKLDVSGDIIIPNGSYYYARRSTSNAAIGVLGFAAGSDALTIKGGSSGASTSIQFQDTGGTIAVFYNGNLGIGTTVPSTKLHIVNTDADVELRLTANNTGVTEYDPVIRFTGQSNSTSEGFKLWYDNSVGDTYFDNVYQGTGTDPAIRFRTGTAGTAINALTIIHNGNVGVGTTSPNQKLYIAGNYGSASAAGTTQGGILRLHVESGVGYGETLDMGMWVGVSGPASHGWIQATNTGNLAVSYSLALNPRGGNIGIGTTIPQQKLHVFDSTTFAYALVRGIDSNLASGYALQHGGGGARTQFDGTWNIGYGSAETDFGLTPNLGGGLVFWFTSGSTTTNPMTLKRSGAALFTGNVGIGTTSSNTTLHLQNSSGPVLRLVRTTNRFDLEAGTNDMGLVSRDSAAAPFYFSGFGNIGIGTLTPQSKLHVQGGDILILDAAGAGGRVKGYDDHHAIYFRENNKNATNYYEYGGNLAGGDKGHRFLTGGVSSSQALRFNVCDDASYFSTPLLLQTGVTSSEANLLLGAKGTDEGGQMIFQKGTNYQSASHLDNFQNKFRIMRGTDVGSQVVQFLIQHEDGNIGIGSTNPAYKLDVAGTGRYTGNLRTDGVLNWNGSVGALSYGSGIVTMETNDATSIYLKTNGSTAISIDTSQRVGIGTTSTTFKLRVQGTSYFFDETYFADKIGVGTISLTYKADIAGAIGNYWNGTAFTGTPLALAISNTTAGGYDPVLLYRQTDSGGTTKLAGGIGVVGRSSWTAGNNGSQISDMYFLVRNDSDGITERMRIASSGNVGIGTTTPDSLFHIARASSGGVGGQIVIDNNAGSALGNTAEISFLTDAGASGAGTRNARILAVNDNAGNGAANMQFHTWDGGTSAERMRITNSGNILINTSSFSSPSLFNVKAAGSDGNQIYICQSNDDRGWRFKAKTDGHFYLQSSYIAATSERFMIQYDTGNVGIGTATATAKLHIEGNSIVVNTENSAQAKSIYFRYSDGATIQCDSYFRFNTGGSPTEKMRITADGTVGIGTTAPLNLVHAQGNPDSLGRLLRLTSTAPSCSLNFSHTANGGLVGYANVGSTGNLFYATTGAGTIGSGIAMDNSSNFGINVTSMLARLHVSSDASSGTAPTVYLTHNAGYGHISALDPYHSLILRGIPSGSTGYGVTAGDQMSFVEYGGDFRFYRKDGTPPVLQGRLNGGTWTVTGDVVAYGSPSDISLKTNIQPLESALDKVTKLQGVSFTWKEDTETNQMTGIKDDIGFIAQQVQEVLPELVRKNDNGLLSLRDKGITALLVEAIKEQQKQIDELKYLLQTQNK